MNYPSLPLSATSVNIHDGAFSPLYDITWSINYEIVNWNENDQYGLCFFLRNTTVPLTRGIEDGNQEKSNGGGVGIDLGYSGAPDVVPGQPRSEGLVGTIIGIGLDTHGVFAAQTTWPDGTDRDGLSDIDLIPNSVTVRGGIETNFEYINTREIKSFNLLSDGPKILRARLGNFGRTVYLDYRSPGDTDFINLIEQDVDLSFAKETRLTPGVSFAKPLTSANGNMNIKVNTFHVEGRGRDPERSSLDINPLSALGCSQSPIGVPIYDEPVDEVLAQVPVKGIDMCVVPISLINITKEVVDLKDVYAIGDTVSYKITVTNIGTKTLTNVTLTDELIPLAVPNSVVDSSNIVTGGISLAAGQEVVVTYDYITRTSDDGGVVVNTATVTTAELPAKTASAQIQVGELAGLVVSKEVTTPPPYLINSTAGFRVTVYNPNYSPIENVIVTDSLSGSKFTVTSDSSSLFTGTTLAARTSAIAEYTYDIDASDVGLVENTATVDSELGRSSDISSIFVGDLKPLTVAKEVTSTKPYYLIGDTITYSISVQNPNLVSVDGIRVIDSQDPINVVSDPSSLFTGTALAAETLATATYSYTLTDNTTEILTNTATLSWLKRDNTEAIATASAEVQQKGVGCVFASLIDESTGSGSASDEVIAESWRDFRDYLPDNKFAILWEDSDIENATSRLKLPIDFQNDANAEVVQIVKNSLTQSNTAKDDWFDKLSLFDYASGTTVYLWADPSGSQRGFDRYQGDLSSLQTTMALSGMTLITNTSNQSEDWAAWHSSLASGLTATCTF